MKSRNEMINVVGSNVGIVEGDTNDTLSIKETVGDGCLSIFYGKDINLDSNGSCTVSEINN